MESKKKMKRKREEITTTTTTTAITITTSTITLKEEEEKKIEGEEEFKQEYSFNKKRRITLSLSPQRKNTHDFGKAKSIFRQAKHNPSEAQTSSRIHPADYQEPISLKQSEFLSHDSRIMLREANHEPPSGACAKAHDLVCKSCLKINDENHLICHDLPSANHVLFSENHEPRSSACGESPHVVASPRCVRLCLTHDSQYICLNINIFDIPNDILGIIIIFTDIIGKHVLRFTNKYFHNIVHSVVGSNLLLPKKFYEYNYNRIAAEFGNIPLYDWVMKIFGENKHFQTYDLNIAALNGNLNLMKHMKKYYNCKWSKVTYVEAAKGGHLEVLKWLKEDGCPFSNETCEVAASSGHSEVLKWLRENGCPWNEQTCRFAASNGHLELLKWARENGCPWNENTCIFAAMTGNFETLKWARENGCPWDSNTTYAAEVTGHLEILKWAIENGCEYYHEVT
jgi:hypothetical protein